LGGGGRGKKKGVRGKCIIVVTFDGEKAPFLFLPNREVRNSTGEDPKKKTPPPQREKTVIHPAWNAGAPQRRRATEKKKVPSPCIKTKLI